MQAGYSHAAVLARTCTGPRMLPSKVLNAGSNNENGPEFSGPRKKATDVKRVAEATLSVAR